MIYLPIQSMFLIMSEYWTNNQAQYNMKNSVASDTLKRVTFNNEKEAYFIG